MIIAIEVQRLFRAKKHGMEIVALEILQKLQQKDLKNKYFIFSKKDKYNDCIIATSNFFIELINGKAFYPLWEQFYLLKKVNKIEPYLLHCTSNTAPLFCKAPLIITIHDVIYMESLNFTGSSYQNFGNIYRRFIVPLVAKKAAVIITVSAYEKKIIAEKLQISEDKIEVIYNGVNPQFKPIDDKLLIENFRQKYNLPEKFLLHFGNTAPKKNTTGVLLAYHIYTETVLNPLPLVLTDCTVDYINKLATKLNIPSIINHTIILDYIPFNNISLLYNLATLFLYPSHRESFGMPVIEAMACGVPVITSNTSALPEIAGEAAYLINPAEPSEICGAILTLLSDEDLYQQLKEKGFTNAARFSWEIAAEKTLRIYEDVANKNCS